MPTSQLTKVIDYIRRIVLAGREAELTDGQLLECFVCHRDEAAVAALVQRHGPMVWGVCRRVLPSHQDAEDAFQATFLVLLRKAASISSKEKVGNWLYGVAHQTALKARAMSAKRMGREKQVNEMPEPKARTESDLWTNLQPLLDQELSRLPDKYRLAIVLCDLEGKTRKETARQLKIPEGTLSTRLTTARTMLAKRLSRHGLALSGGSLAVAISQNAASACVPTSVMSSTIKTMTLGEVAAADLISVKVAALTEGVVKSMLLTKLKTMVALVLMVVSMVTLTTAMLVWGQTGDKGNSGEKPAAKDEKQAAQAQPKDSPKDFTNSIGMKFVWIKPGSFMMGSPKEEKERFDFETQHKVTLTKGFYMGVYTVTQEQWKEVMGNNPSSFKGEKNLPVETVSWDDCQEFIKKLREKDKKQYRLPSEAEWEFACRAGTTTPFHFGETISTDQANYNGDFTYGEGKKGVHRKKTTPVGSFPANAWGLHDMHGNVMEWCQDCWSDYPQKDVVDPTGPEKPEKGESRVLRGGSWSGYPLHCRSANRYGIEPGSRGNGVLGCRLCFSLEQEATPYDQPKDAEGEKDQTLTVSIKPQKDRTLIKEKELFKVDLRVVNLSKLPQSFKVMSCSWYEHWKTNNERVSWMGWDCKENSPTDVKLAPGEAYEKTLPMLRVAGKPKEKASFKMGFTPIGSKQTFWSNEVTLQVDPVEKQGAKDDPPKEFTNSVGMKFVLIKPGNFVMGSPKEEKLRHDDEVQHKVTLTKGFYMGVHLVTQEEWKAVMGNNPNLVLGEKNLPVNSVSWDDCQEFVKKMRDKDQKPYRLPTEAEWEYSCRAGTTTPFCFGETISSDQVNYDGEKVYGDGKKGVRRGKSTPVGSFPANAWGLHDMHGNLWEYCQDWYGEYPKEDVVDPQGPQTGERRAMRGGSFIEPPATCRSAYRSRIDPQLDRYAFRAVYGVRVCFSAD